MATTGTGTGGPPRARRSPRPVPDPLGSDSPGGPRAGGAGRLLFIPLWSRPSRWLVGVLALAGAAWLATGLIRTALADALAGPGASLAQLERAVAWDPGNPDLHLRLGHGYLGLGDAAGLARARAHLARALQARPTHDLTWLALALLADREGDGPYARRALDTALRLAPHNVSLRWEAALLRLRWGEREPALGHLGYLITVDPTRRDVAFELAQQLLGPDESLAKFLVSEAEPLTTLFALALGHGDLALARVVWARRSTLAPAVPQALQRQYLELLLTARDGAAARRLWATLVPDGHPAAGANAVWNGGFEAPGLLGWGFDWQVQRVWGVEVSLAHSVATEGRQSLRLSFNSPATLDFAGVFTNVAVEPGRPYRLRVLAKAVEFTTQSGLKLQVVAPEAGRILAETPAVTGTTTDWVPLETPVRIPAGVSLVQVRLRREPVRSGEGPLGGSVWVDAVRLTPEGA